MTNNFNIPTEYLTDDEMAKLGEIVNRLDDLNKRDTYQTKFIDFVKHVWLHLLRVNITRYMQRSYRMLQMASQHV